MHMLSTTEIAKILGLNPRTIREYFQKEKLRGTKRSNGQWEMSESDFKNTALYREHEFKNHKFKLGQTIKVKR